MIKNFMKKFFSEESGVSPVIGVMLMVVVTVILAAAVSSYATNVENTEMAPQVAISAEGTIISGQEYITIDHLSGDPLAKEDVYFQTHIPSGTFADITYQIDKSTMTSARDGAYWTSFTRGDILTVSIDDAFATGTYGLMAPGSGERAVLEIYDGATDKPVASVSFTMP